MLRVSFFEGWDVGLRFLSGPKQITNTILGILILITV